MPKKGPSTIEDRIHRVQGQLAAVERQVTEGEDIEKIMIQLQAVISSLESINIELVKNQFKVTLDESLERLFAKLK